MVDIYDTLKDRRNRTAILKMSPNSLNIQPEVNDINRVHVIDWLEDTKRNLRTTQKLISTDSQREWGKLLNWCQLYPQKLLLIKNSDYMLTKLTVRDRYEFWRRSLHGLPHLESVIAFMVVDSPEVLPPNLLEWIGEGRVFSLFKTGEVVKNADDQ
jgi:hypothetical protein